MRELKKVKRLMSHALRRYPHRTLLQNTVWTIATRLKQLARSENG